MRFPTWHSNRTALAICCRCQCKVNDTPSAGYKRSAFAHTCLHWYHAIQLQQWQHSCQTDCSSSGAD
ncbi:unnamed protein product [Staurois parvus]|uniref:Uncharacterized protein n=1 Tax=Staurois parvus TaxID=386267 RepID=A0ABN9DEN6_9NEOB|nr:unnamed protein product [Staurois parvus]